MTTTTPAPSSSSSSTAPMLTPVKEMWVDGSRWRSDHGGYAVVARQSDGRWAGQFYLVRRAMDDVRRLELLAIDAALSAFLAGCRSAEQAYGIGNVPYVSFVIYTDCRDALDEIELYSGGPNEDGNLPFSEMPQDLGRRRHHNPRVTEVTHRDLIRGISNKLVLIGQCGPHACIAWQQRMSTEGMRVADAWAGHAADLAQRAAGRSHIQREQSFQNASPPA